MQLQYPNSNIEFSNENFTQYNMEINQLATSVYNHAALDNDFYDYWINHKLTASQMEIFATNYYHWIAPTPQRIALAFLVVSDLPSRAKIVSNLSDELGHGHAESVHALILNRWLSSLHNKVTGKQFVNTNVEHPLILETTHRLNEESFKLCSSSAQMACGALLAQEWHAYTQFVKLYEGYRNYIDLYKLDEFHDLAEYLYIHIGWAEKEHKEQTILMAARNCKTPQDFEMLKKGFNGFLNLLADFWQGIYLQIEKAAAA